MRCMITANRRASATIAFFIPRCLAIFMAQALSQDHFSNRPFGVKRFQTIHHCGVGVARGLVLLFGIGARALPVWDSKTRRNNLSGGLAVSRRQNQADMRTHLIHRPATSVFHCSVELGFPPIELILWT